jgi:hypothetical protein
LIDAVLPVYLRFFDFDDAVLREASLQLTKALLNCQLGRNLIKSTYMDQLQSILNIRERSLLSSPNLDDQEKFEASLIVEVRQILLEPTPVDDNHSFRGTMIVSPAISRNNSQDTGHS